MAVPKIGESEWYVMKALWEESPLSGGEIVKAVSEKTDWSQSTILTMVRRLVTKNAIGVEQGRVMRYYPLIEENKIKKIETDIFIKRVYEGSVGMLVKGFIESGELTEEEVCELKRLLDDMKQE